MNENRWGSVLRAGVSVVIGLALAGSVGRAAAQYLRAQPPSVVYPPPAFYAYPAGPPHIPTASRRHRITAL